MSPGPTIDHRYNGNQGLHEDLTIMHDNIPAVLVYTVVWFATPHKYR